MFAHRFFRVFKEVRSPQRVRRTTKLNENSKPRPTNEKEKQSAEELYRELESDFLDIGGMFIDEDEWEKENGR